MPPEPDSHWSSAAQVLERVLGVYSLELGPEMDQYNIQFNQLYSDGFAHHIDTISIGLRILYFKGPHVEVLCCISSGSSLLAKVPVKGFPEYKGLRSSVG